MSAHGRYCCATECERVFLRQSQTGRQKGGVGHGWQRDGKEEKRDGGIMDDNVRNRRGASERDYLIWLLSIQQRHSGPTHPHPHTHAHTHRGEGRGTLRLLKRGFSPFLYLTLHQHFTLPPSCRKGHCVGEKHPSVHLHLQQCHINTIFTAWTTFF